jgi:glycerophosphoryl diester phosphodiesterase
MDLATSWIAGSPIAHRGLHDATIPENSLAAFDAAAKAGHPIEMDIRLSADGKLVILHDTNTQRLTGEDHQVSRTDHAVLASLRLNGTAQAVQLFTEALRLVNGQVPLLVEVKHGIPARRICPRLLAALRDYPGEVAIQSFDPRILWWLRRHAPHLARGQISGFLDDMGVPILLKPFLRAMVFNIATAPHFISYEIGCLSSFPVSLWRALLRSPLLAWTIRTEDQASAARSRQANLIFEGNWMKRWHGNSRMQM